MLTAFFEGFVLMGAFKDWQPFYAQVGLPTFPVKIIPGEDNRKVPAVKGYGKIGSRISAELAARSQFQEADILGCMLGKGSGITVLDIDTTDEGVLREALKRHGDTPVISRTASRKFQCFYRYADERRAVRPWGKDRPIDLLGGGFGVLPPSMRDDGGSYLFIRGGIFGLRSLPIMRGVDDLKRRFKDPQRSRPDLNIVTGGKVPEGHRNTALWRACMMQAKQCNSFDDLLSYARQHNEEHMQPNLSGSEVIAIANSAWRYEENGMNSFGGPRTLSVPDERVFQALCTRPAGSDAIVLYLHLQRAHFWRDEFILAQAYAQTLGWTKDRFLKARLALVETNIIKRISQGGRYKGDAAWFAWVKPERHVVKAA
jgi:Bifunctional DNA primase/polymerase, N-terminal/Primase C terminal 1 (PriCT-1)